MVKVYLGLHEGAVRMELDVHDLSYKFDIKDGNFKETARNVVAPERLLTYLIGHLKGL